jgi:hypothetical protein
MLDHRRLKTPMRILPTKLKVLVMMEANDRVRACSDYNKLRKMPM